MPETIANWLIETMRPLIRAGDISAIYIGLVIEAAPTPIPPMILKIMNSNKVLGKAVPSAEIRKRIITSLKPLAELSIISMTRLKNNIKSKIETEFRKKKMPLSILGRDLEFERVSGYLGMYRSLTEIKQNIEKIKSSFKAGKIHQNNYNSIMEVLQTAKAEMESEIKIGEEQLIRLENLNKKYND